MATFDELIKPEHQKTVTLFFVVTEIALLILLFLLPNPIIFIPIIFFILILPFIISNPTNILLVLIIYILILPNQDWGSTYEFFKVYVDMKIVSLLILFIFIIIYIQYLKEKKWKIDFCFLDIIIFLFLVYIVLNALWGLSQSNTISNVLVDLLFIVLYCMYFIARFLIKNTNWIKKFIFVFLIATTLSSIQYIFFSLHNFDFSNIFITRVTTQQPHLAQISIPLLFSFGVFYKKIKYRILTALLIIPNFLMVLLSQQRALYIAIIFSILLVLIFYYFRKGFGIKKLVKFVLGAVGIIIFLFFILLLMDKYFNLHFFLTVFQRMDTLQNISADTSWKIRFSEIEIALQKWKENPLIGKGLGATYPNIHKYRGHFGLDNSYAYVLWKTGIFGLLLFLLIYINFFWSGIKVYWKMNSDFDKFLIAGLVSGMAGMLLIAITNRCIILYRFNIIWAIIIAIIIFYDLNILRPNDKEFN